MIILTRLDNGKVLVNCDSVKYVEATPDTLITFLNGDSLIVKESLDDIRELAIRHKAAIFSVPGAGTTKREDP